ncbi:MAG: histidine phosphatase family protein [Rhodocyclaceae bacterium]|nr:histidine phosphatase family protein [Rhodocyclaceae bacterium]
MDLILWRHAQAADGEPDASRPLTSRGEKEAQLVARWLRQHLPKKTRILASPSLRTRQTAEALELPFETSAMLAPGAGVAEHLAAAGWPEGEGGRCATVLVGHQPALGRLAALLLSGAEADWTIKKGAVWWFTNRVRDGETQTVLKAVIGPDMLG